MPSIRVKSYRLRLRGEKWHTCALCEKNKYIRVWLKFDSCSVEPQTDEVLTGASSTDYGTVTEVDLVSGSYAGGDAVGFVYMKDVSGIVEFLCFENNEAVNGSVGGSDILTADGQGVETTYGFMHPLSNLVEAEDGKWYCLEHYTYKNKLYWLSQGDIDTSEPERGELP